MSTIQPVKPGQLITSTLMNQIIEKLEAMEAPADTVTVPNVFGMKVSTARGVITKAGSPFTIGAVLDVTGAVVDVIASDAQKLVVINQLPPPGWKAVPGSSINLLVSGTGSTTPPEPQLKVTKIVPTEVSLDGSVEIHGENFDSFYSNNSVAFDNVAADVRTDSTTTILYVTVPPGIPGAPEKPGDKKKDNVQVKVSVGEKSASITCSILPPTGVARPRITAIEPEKAQVKYQITIKGTGFSGKIGENAVTFDGKSAEVTEASPTELKVFIPNNIPGLTQLGASRSDVHLVVSVKDVPSGGDAPLPPPYICTISR